MRVHVYCDESRHTQPDGFMALGSIWVPDDVREELSRRLRQCLKANAVGAEVKWQKTSNQLLPVYVELVNALFDTPGVSSRVIVLDNALIDPGFHEGDAELGFYKFYYELLEKWILPDNEYNVLLDFKQNRETGRHRDLRNVLRNKFGQPRIIDVNVLDSGETPIAMLCDLITGAVAAAWSRQIRAGGPKEALAVHVAERRGSSLLLASTSPAIEKLNIFHLRLSEGAQE